MGKLTESETLALVDLACRPTRDLPASRPLAVLLDDEGRDIYFISQAVKLHPTNVAKWIRRYQDRGIDGLRTGRSGGRPVVFSGDIRRKILQLYKNPPRAAGLDYDRWTHERLRQGVIHTKIVPDISVGTIRLILQGNKS